MHVRTLLVGLVALTAITTAAPSATAEPGWTLIGSGRIEAQESRLGAVTGLLGAAAKPPCVPDRLESRELGLSWQTWYNAEYGRIAFQWHDTGQTSVSDTCANAATTCIRINDYAAAGRPVVVRGIERCATETRSVNGVITATAHADLWVVYYDGLAQRGQSLIEVIVRGSYRQHHDKKAAPAPCIAVYYQVTPTPGGPIVSGPSEPQPCAG